MNNANDHHLNTANNEVQECISPEREPNQLEYGESDDEEEETDVRDAAEESSKPSTSELPVTRPLLRRIPRRRRLSTYESSDGILDLESDIIGGSARSI